MKALVLVGVLGAALAGCTKQGVAMSTGQALPGESYIACFSGNMTIYRGIGKVVAVDGTNWTFEDRALQRTVQVSGNCVVRN